MLNADAGFEPAPLAAARAADKRRGEAVRYAIGKSSLGPLLVAATNKGLCALLFADEPAALAQEARARFSCAVPAEGDNAFEEFAGRAAGCVETPAKPPDVALDARGTPFQRRVWAALRAIPPGSTASYAEIARQIGRPTAARAVAQACAANTIAVLIPCHRVVRADGGLSGYRGGVWRKRALLEREKGA